MFENDSLMSGIEERLRYKKHQLSQAKSKILIAQPSETIGEFQKLMQKYNPLSPTDQAFYNHIKTIAQKTIKSTGPLEIVDAGMIYHTILIPTQSANQTRIEKYNPINRILNLAEKLANAAEKSPQDRPSFQHIQDTMLNEIFNYSDPKFFIETIINDIDSLVK